MTDGTTGGTAIGLHRVLEPAGVLPQAAHRLDADPRIGPDEVRVAVERLNLDAASYRQLHTAHGGDAAAVRAEVLRIIGERGKMHNPVTGSGGMLVGVVEEAGPDSPLGLKPGDRVATLVSLTLTPLAVTDGLAGWDGRSEQVPARGHAVLFALSIAAVLPGDVPVPARPVGAGRVRRPGADPPRRGVADGVRRVVRRGRAGGRGAGAAGKSGCLALAAARRAGASRLVGLVPDGGGGGAAGGVRAGRRVVRAARGTRWRWRGRSRRPVDRRT
ncbi:hypothetical protein [Actinomadura sp. CNU-125]|uniref:L-erythro-3,5-diaminohexanoate dehydrogenase n=1 Tax=Actinomadura sp. CNU-125 TaxID=1904961 RepID=UPI000AA32749|nr:hypothetical protein [Actinomadura sp. CNU-125]